MPIPAHDGSSVHVLTIRNEQICRVSSRCDAVDMRIVSMHGRHSTRQMEPRKDAIQITAERHAMRIARADPNGEIESSALSALFIISSCFACLEFRVTLSSARRDDRFASRRRPWTPSPRHCSARCLPRRHPDSSTRRTVISSAWPSSWAWSLCVDATLRRRFLRDDRNYCEVCGALTLGTVVDRIEFHHCEPRDGREQLEQAVLVSQHRRRSWLQRAMPNHCVGSHISTPLRLLSTFCRRCGSTTRGPCPRKSLTTGMFAHIPTADSA